MLRSSSDSPYMLLNGEWKPLARSRSDSFSIKSSRSRSSSGLPVYFEYLYFTSVVILLLAARKRKAVIEVAFGGAGGLAPGRLGGVISAVLAAADLLLRVQPFQDKVDRGRHHRLRILA